MFFRHVQNYIYAVVPFLPQQSLLAERPRTVFMFSAAAARCRRQRTYVTNIMEYREWKRRTPPPSLSFYYFDSIRKRLFFSSSSSSPFHVFLYNKPGAFASSPARAFLNRNPRYVMLARAYARIFRRVLFPKTTKEEHEAERSGETIVWGVSRLLSLREFSFI